MCISAESYDEAAAGLVKRLEAPHPPTAVFSSNIPTTMSLVLALQRAERTDVALVGFGDFPMAAALSPAVTVLDQDPGGLGRIAVERLVQRIEEPHARLRRRTPGRALPPEAQTAEAEAQDRSPGSPDPERVGRTAPAPGVTLTGKPRPGPAGKPRPGKRSQVRPGNRGQESRR